MKTISRLFYGGTFLTLGLALTLQCNNDNRGNNGNGNLDMQAGGTADMAKTGGDGGNLSDGGSSTSDLGQPGTITLTAASPAQGPTTGNNLIITLSGTNFPSDAVVYIDNQRATPQGTPTATQIQVVLPAEMTLGKRGKVPVEIRRPGIGAVAMNSNIFSYYFGTPRCDLLPPPGTDVGGSSPEAILLVDLNPPGGGTAGRLDAIVTNKLSDNIGVLLGNGDGKFAAVATYSTGINSRPWGVAVGNFGNGHLSVATSNFKNDSVSVLLNDGTGVLGSPQVYKISLLAGSSPTGIAAGMLDADTLDDVVIANSGDSGNPSNNVSLLIANGMAANNYLSSPLPLASDTLSNPSPNDVAVADMNGDGKPDIVVANNQSGSIGIMLNNKPSPFGLSGNYPTGGTGSAPQPRAMTVGDFDGDGLLDVAVTLTPDPPRVSVLLGNPANKGTLKAFTQFTAGAANGNAPYGIASGDLNGDGLADLVVALNGSTKIAILMAQKDQSGNFSFAAPLTCPITFDSGANPIPRAVAIGDLNGDGNPDIAVTNTGDNKLNVLLNKFQ